VSKQVKLWSLTCQVCPDWFDLQGRYFDLIAFTMSSECVIHFMGFGFFVGAVVVTVVVTGVMEEEEDAEQEEEESRRLRLGGSALLTPLTLLVRCGEEVGSRAGVVVVDEDCFSMPKGIVNNLSF
jgi:hypothetical protein